MPFSIFQQRRRTCLSLDFCNLPPWENICVKIEARTILPTTQQNFAAVCVCQMLSNYYRDISLFRFDLPSGNIYILAAETMEILISRDGIWRFIDET
jgi:hypothetical protein